jgi:hypothetical protein
MPTSKTGRYSASLEDEDFIYADEIKAGLLAWRTSLFKNCLLQEPNPQKEKTKTEAAGVSLGWLVQFIASLRGLVKGLPTDRTPAHETLTTEEIATR